MNILRPYGAWDTNLKLSKDMKKNKKKRNYSLTGEIAVIIIGLVVGVVVLCWFLNTALLEKYYVINKQNTLLSGFWTIDEVSMSDELTTSDFDITFDNLCANGNITIMIISADQTIIRSSVNDTQKMLREFRDIIFGGRGEETVILTQSENYVMQRRTDTRLNSEYLVLYGTLSNGNLILMRSALESIRESVKISNKFLLYIGFVTIFLSTLAAWFISRRITTPLLELTNISKRMTELDFEAKYRPKVKRKNEIDELGEHMNELSYALEQTISELKSANNQLLIDIEKKTQIDEMRKEFLSNVSHELKTPLALIQGYAEGLKECINEDAESRDFYCEVIMDEADKMNVMVKKLLTLNQLEFGNEEVKMERFNLTELICGVIHASDILLNQNGIQLTFEEEDIYAWADEFKVEEVVTNYLSNAIHYAENEKEIRIYYTKGQENVRVSVFNTGNQIPEQDIDNIWIKFYKVDKARTREYGGNGIGLSIVKAIMESFHQNCGVVNHENGVEFWFELDTGN